MSSIIEIIILDSIIFDLTVTGATQNAGSDKKQSSSGSWKSIDLMRELDKQSSKRYNSINTYISDIAEF